MLLEIRPKDPHVDGIVQWLMLNKKLNQWKSSRATAEVLYTLAKYLNGQGLLGKREEVQVTAGGETAKMEFSPEKFEPKHQIRFETSKSNPAALSTIEFKKQTPGLAFASATWRFSTDKPELIEENGDFFKVSRRYFLRELKGSSYVLRPLAEGTTVKVGDSVEVQIDLSTKHLPT